MKNPEKITAFSLLLVINFFFSWKYLDRFTEWSLLLSFALTLVYIASWILAARLPYRKIYTWFAAVIVLSYAAGMVLAFEKFPVSGLNVDRWSVISSFWENFNQGLYPYKARSHMGNYPGPMPFYFILAYPFLSLGELGYLSIAGFLLLAFLLLRMKNMTAVFSLVFLVTSPLTAWEILSRSTILVNTTLVLLYVILLLRYRIDRPLSLFLFAIAGGLLLSTRSVFILSYLFLVILFLKNKEFSVWKIAAGGLTLMLVFVLTFLPFVLPFPGEFREMNPFTIQSSFLIPSGYIPLFLALTVAVGLMRGGEDRVWLFNGVIYFLVIFIYFVYCSFSAGIKEAYFGSAADISYFIFAVPFLLYAQAESKAGKSGQKTRLHAR